jgi:hypothetical protein
MSLKNSLSKCSNFLNVFVLIFLRVIRVKQIVKSILVLLFVGLVAYATASAITYLTKGWRAEEWTMLINLFTAPLIVWKGGAKCLFLGLFLLNISLYLLTSSWLALGIVIGSLVMIVIKNTNK